MEKLLSVIIPIYNTEPYISKCLDSIIEEKLENIEILCINDASTDKSYELLCTYERKYDYLHVFSNKNNKGVSASRNLGLKYAMGKYVMFLDSDDYIKTGDLNKFVTRCEKYTLDVIYFSYENFYDDLELQVKYKKKVGKNMRKGCYDNNVVLNGIEMIESFVLNGDFIMSAVVCMIRRDFLNENLISFNEEIIYEDAPFSLEVLLHAKRAMCINEVFYFRRIRESSIEHSKFTGYHLYSYLKSCIIMYHLIQNKQSVLEDSWNSFVIVMSRRINTLLKHSNKVEEAEYKKFQKMCALSEILFFESMKTSRDMIVAGYQNKLHKCDANITKLENEAVILRRKNEQLNSDNKKLKIKMKKIKNSKQYKIGGAILKPVRLIRNYFK